MKLTFEAENTVEDYLIKACKNRKWFCTKFVSPSRSGVPDRIIIANNITLFVELKATGETPRRLQKRRIDEMRINGAIVFVLDHTSKIDALIHQIESNQIDLSISIY